MRKIREYRQRCDATSEGYSGTAVFRGHVISEVQFLGGRFGVSTNACVVAYLLDEWEKRFLDGARFNLRELYVNVGQAGGRHGARGRDCAGARRPLGADTSARRHVAPPAPRTAAT